MAVGDEPEVAALRKDCSFIVDRAIFEAEEQARGNPITADDLEEVTHREHAAFIRTQRKKAVESSLHMAHRYGLSWRTRLQDTEEHGGK